MCSGVLQLGRLYNEEEDRKQREKEQGSNLRQKSCPWGTGRKFGDPLLSRGRIINLQNGVYKVYSEPSSSF